MMSFWRIAAKAIAAMIADALGEARIVGRELEIGPVGQDELEVCDRPSMPSTTNDIVRRRSISDGDEPAQILGHRSLRI